MSDVIFALVIFALLGVVHIVVQAEQAASRRRVDEWIAGEMRRERARRERARRSRRAELLDWNRREP